MTCMHLLNAQQHSYGRTTTAFLKQSLILFMYSLGYMDTTDSCAGPGTIIYLEHLQMMAHVRWVEFSETKLTCLSDNF